MCGYCSYSPSLPLGVGNNRTEQREGGGREGDLTKRDDSGAARNISNSITPLSLVSPEAPCTTGQADCYFPLHGRPPLLPDKEDKIISHGVMMQEERGREEGRKEGRL